MKLQRNVKKEIYRTQHTVNSLKPSTDNSIAEHTLLEVGVEVVKQKSGKFFLRSFIKLLTTQSHHTLDVRTVSSYFIELCSHKQWEVCVAKLTIHLIFFS